MHKADLLGIQAFVAIAELGSFGRAAEHLHISQTALSRRIAKLEASVEGRLVNRTTRSVGLTAAGADFLPRARRILRELSASLVELKESNLRGYGHVVMACLPTIASSQLSRIIASYAASYPRNRVQILDRSATEIRQAVLQSDAEFGISVLPTPHNALEQVTLFEDPVVVVCPADHPLARHDTLDWKDLEGEPLIGIGTLSGLRMQIDEVTQENGLQILFAYEVQHLSTAVGLVQGGAGIAILPMGACAAIESQGLRVIALARPHVSRTIRLFKRHDHRLSPAAQPLYDMILAALRTEPRA